MQYAGLCGCAIVCAFLRSFALAATCTQAASALHKSMLQAVLAAPLSLFETTPIGQVTNRFSADVDTLDFSLQSQLQLTMDMACTLATSALVLVSQEPSLAVAFALLSIVYLRVQRLFNVSATALKRIDTATKSPVFTLFSQTLDGVSSIRPLQVSGFLEQAMTDAIDDNTASYLAWAHVNRWLGVRLDFLGAFITGLTACLCLFSPSSVFGGGESRSFGAGGAGLLITYAITVTRTLSGSVRSMTQLNVNMATVERVIAFAQTPPEHDHADATQAAAAAAPAGKKKQRGRDVELGAMWPRSGRIMWSGVECRYEKGGEKAALWDVSLAVEHGVCLGVCGRTGAGKSSLLMSLLRVLKCARGRIEVDGRDVSRVALRSLRSSIAVIPQDPVQVASRVREAVDPLHQFTDAKVQAMLHEVGFTEGAGGGNEDVVGTGVEGEVRLDLELKEGGANLSVGQRQLLCLARALLTKKKILALDESTAHLDAATAASLRRTVLKLRGKQTVIIIAHRLEDIAICDQVVVMDEGRIEEQGRPIDLLQDPRGAFSNLVNELDADSVANIRALALEASNMSS